jgi:P-type E1-E2 ATPase
MRSRCLAKRGPLLTPDVAPQPARRVVAAVTNLELATRGIRVIAVAVGHGDEARDLTLLGLIGLADPPRPEARQAVREAQEAGVRPVMITGDHAATAEAIAAIPACSGRWAR